MVVYTTSLMWGDNVRLLMLYGWIHGSKRRWLLVAISYNGDMVITLTYWKLKLLERRKLWRDNDMASSDHSICLVSQQT